MKSPRAKSKSRRPNTGGTLLPGTGRGGVHRSRKHPSGKELRKALAAKQDIQ